VSGSISDAGTSSGSTITWQVSLSPGESRTLTYQATVSTDASLVGTTLVNTVTVAGLSDTTTHGVGTGSGSVEEIVEPDEPDADETDEAESEDVEPSVEELVIVSEPSTGQVARIGADVGGLVTAALLAMLPGGLMVTFERRRRRT